MMIDYRVGTTIGATVPYVSITRLGARVRIYYSTRSAMHMITIEFGIARQPFEKDTGGIGSDRIRRCRLRSASARRDQIDERSSSR
jgi:hypothetical protein